MAGTKVRGITIDLGVDASGVSSGLRKVNSDINSTARELKDIEKLLKLDPTNVQLLAQKQETLQRQLTQTRDKLDLLKKAEEELQSKMVDGGTEEQKRQLAALQREIISTENSLEKYENELDQTGKETKDLTKAEQQATKATGQMGEGFTVLKGALASLVASGIRKAVDGFKDLMTAGPEYADQILEMADKTSMATDKLQELKYMSDLVDVDVNTVAKSMQKLTKNMSAATKGSGSAYDAFTKLGVSIKDQNGNLRDNEEVFYDAIEALSKMEEGTERDALAMNIFGKSATDLNPMINAGADALKGFAEEAHEMGYVLDEDALEALGRVQDEFDRFGKQMEGVKNQIAAGVAPAIERGMKKIRDVVQKIDWKKIGQKMGDAFNKLIDALSWIVDHGALIKSLLTGIVSAMATAKVLQFVNSISSLVSALKAATIAQEGMNMAANANPYVLMATVIIGLGAALISWQKSLAEATKEADAGWQATNRLTEAATEQVAAIDAVVSSYNEMAEAREASVSAGMAEISHVESLYEELDSLADANGVVAESDQARAEFILGELNNALGTEYTMTGNVIDQYEKLSGAIDEVIAKKKAEVILSAQEDAYREAIVKRDEAEKTLADTITKKSVIERKMAENTAHMNDLMSATGPQLAANAKEIGELNLQNIELQKSLDELDGKYEESAEVVNKYAYDIKSYEDNMAKAIKGDYEDIEYVSYETAKSMGKDMDDYAAQVEADTKAAARSFSGLKGDIERSAAQIGQGVANGIEKGSGPAYRAMSAFGANLLQKFNKEMQIQSPSKKMEKAAQYMVEGVEVGIKKNQMKAVKAVEEMGNRMTIAFASSIAGGVAGNASSMLSLLASPNNAYMIPRISDNQGVAAQAMRAIKNEYIQNIYAPKSPSRIELYRDTRNLLALAGRL